MGGYQKFLSSLRGRVATLTAHETAQRLRTGGQLIDVREGSEFETAHVPDAISIPRGRLEIQIEEHVDRGALCVVMCASGVRSLMAANTLMAMGYTHVHVLKGGLEAWRSAGLPVEKGGLTEAERARYARHLAIPEVGLDGQGRLRDAKVLIVGAGGLGSPAALYLAAAGVGTIGIADDDRVERSNLQRQILHRDDRVGWPKVASAAATLRALNPAIRVAPECVRVTEASAPALVEKYDLVIDGTDNYDTRYLLNGVCNGLRTPYVYGSVHRFEGEVGVFGWVGDSQGSCYRCFHPTAPPPHLTPSCEEAGVLGVLPGVIGCLQAVETVKILLGLGDPLLGTVLHYDGLSSRFWRLAVPRDEQCGTCTRGAASSK